MSAITQIDAPAGAPSDATTAAETAPRIVPPATPRRVLLVLGAAFAISYGITQYLGGAQDEPVTGYLRTATTTVVSPREGRLVELLAREGERVEAGTPIAMLVDDRAAERIAERKRAVAALEAELARVRARADVEIAWRMRTIEAELLQTRLQAAEFLQQKLQHELESLAWSELSTGALASSAATGPFGGIGEFESVVFERQLPEEARLRAILRQDAARSAAEVYQVQAELCDARLQTLESLKAALPDEVRRACGVEEVELRLAEARAELAAAEKLSARFPLVATGYGVLGGFQWRPGDAVPAGSAVVEVHDVARPHVLLPVPSQDAPRFAAGSEVELVFPGGVERRGRVESVRPEAVSPRDAGLLFGGDDSLVTLLVTPVKKLWPETPVGAAVRVTVR